MKIWNCGSYRELTIGQKVFVGRCGTGRSYFGEYARLARTTKQHLVFVTDSGATIKTAIDNLHRVIGKAGKQGWFVSLNVDRDNDPECTISPVYIF